MDDRAGGMGLIFVTADWQTPICDADIQPQMQPARHTDWGVGTQRTNNDLDEGRLLENYGGLRPTHSIYVSRRVQRTRRAGLASSSDNQISIRPSR